MTSRSPLTYVPSPAELRSVQRERRTTAWDWMLFGIVIVAYVALLVWALAMPPTRAQ